VGARTTRLRRRIGVTAAAALALALGGCGSASPEALPPAAGPAASPPQTAPLPGRVVTARDAPAALTAPAAATEVRADRGRLLAVLSPRRRVLEVLDPRTRRPVDRADAGVGPTHVAAEADRLYVADTRGEALLVFRIHPRLELMRRVYLPGAPYAMTVDPVRHRLWITLTAINELVTFPANGRPTEIARFPTPRQPDAVTVDASSGTVAVAGRADGVVQRLGARQAYGEDER
jgi:hypothetical protein